MMSRRNGLLIYDYTEKFASFSRRRKQGDLLKEITLLLVAKGYDAALGWDNDGDRYARVKLAWVEKDDREAIRNKILQMLEDEWKRNWMYASPESLQQIIQRNLQGRRYLVEALLASVNTMGAGATRTCVERFILL